MLDDKPRWVAIYTSSRAEKTVEKRMKELGLEVYLPLIDRRRVWSDRVKIVSEPLIRSYIFARIVAKEAEAVRSVDGVAYIVRPRNYQTIPDREIEAIRRLIDAKQELAIHNTLELHKGATATITGGAFEGMQGTLISDCKDGNFAVRINAIGLSLVTNIERLYLTASDLLPDPEEMQEQGKDI